MSEDTSTAKSFWKTLDQKAKQVPNAKPGALTRTKSSDMDNAKPGSVTRTKSTEVDTRYGQLRSSAGGLHHSGNHQQSEMPRSDEAVPQSPRTRHSIDAAFHPVPAPVEDEHPERYSVDSDLFRRRRVAADEANVSVRERKSFFEQFAKQAVPAPNKPRNPSHTHKKNVHFDSTTTDDPRSAPTSAAQTQSAPKSPDAVPSDSAIEQTGHPTSLKQVEPQDKTASTTETDHGESKDPIQSRPASETPPPQQSPETNDSHLQEVAEQQNEIVSPSTAEHAPDDTKASADNQQTEEAPTPQQSNDTNDNDTQEAQPNDSKPAAPTIESIDIQPTTSVSEPDDTIDTLQTGHAPADEQQPTGHTAEDRNNAIALDVPQQNKQAEDEATVDLTGESPAVLITPETESISESASQPEIKVVAAEESEPETRRFRHNSSGYRYQSRATQIQQQVRESKQQEKVGGLKGFLNKRSSVRVAPESLHIPSPAELKDMEAKSQETANNAKAQIAALYLPGSPNFISIEAQRSKRASYSPGALSRAMAAEKAQQPSSWQSYIPSDPSTNNRSLLLQTSPTSIERQKLSQHGSNPERTTMHRKSISADADLLASVTRIRQQQQQEQQPQRSPKTSPEPTSEATPETPPAERTRKWHSKLQASAQANREQSLQRKESIRIAQEKRDSPKSRRSSPREDVAIKEAPVLNNKLRLRAYDSETTQRLRVLREILNTEIDYIADLNVLNDVFIEQIKARQLLTPDQVTGLFSIVPILKNIHQELLDAFGDIDRPLDDSFKFGEIFVKNVAYLKMYCTYCENHPRALVLLKKLMAQNRDFDTFISLMNYEPRCQGQTCESFMIKPIQRICKYPLLLRELLKETDDNNPDKPNIEKALASIQDIVAQVNDVSKVQESRDKLSFLLRTVEGAKDLGLNSNIDRIVKDAPASMHLGSKFKGRLYMFTDFLLFVKESSTIGRKSARLTGNKDARFGSVQSKVLLNDCELSKHDSNSSLVIIAPTGKHTFTFKTKEECRDWYFVLDRAIADSRQNAAVPTKIQKVHMRTNSNDLAATNLK